MTPAPLVLILALLTLDANAQYKCVAPSGAVSFQDVACPSTARTAAVPPPAAAPVKEWSAAGVKVGMSRAEVYKSAGRIPDRENTTVTSAGEGRQMIFEDRHDRVYVYTDNDVVTAIQSVRR